MIRNFKTFFWMRKFNIFFALLELYFVIIYCREVADTSIRYQITESDRIIRYLKSNLILRMLL